MKGVIPMAALIPIAAHIIEAAANGIIYIVKLFGG